MVSFCKLYDSFRYEDNIMILFFELTLCDNDNQWFQNLSRKRLITWGDFSAQFLYQFHHMWHISFFADLLKITQNSTEHFDKHVDKWFGVAD